MPDIVRRFLSDVRKFIRRTRICHNGRCKGDSGRLLKEKETFYGTESNCHD